MVVFSEQGRNRCNYLTTVCPTMFHHSRGGEISVWQTNRRRSCMRNNSFNVEQQDFPPPPPSETLPCAMSVYTIRMY